MAFKMAARNKAEGLTQRTREEIADRMMAFERTNFAIKGFLNEWEKTVEESKARVEKAETDYNSARKSFIDYENEAKSRIDYLSKERNDRDKAVVTLMEEYVAAVNANDPRARTEAKIKLDNARKELKETENKIAVLNKERAEKKNRMEDLQKDWDNIRGNYEKYTQIRDNIELRDDKGKVVGGFAFAYENSLSGAKEGEKKAQERLASIAKSFDHFKQQQFTDRLFEEMSNAINEVLKALNGGEGKKLVNVAHEVDQYGSKEWRSTNRRILQRVLHEMGKKVGAKDVDEQYKTMFESFTSESLKSINFKKLKEEISTLAENFAVVNAIERALDTSPRSAIGQRDYLENISKVDSYIQEKLGLSPILKEVSELRFKYIKDAPKVERAWFMEARAYIESSGAAPIQRTTYVKWLNKYGLTDTTFNDKNVNLYMARELWQQLTMAHYIAFSVAKIGRSGETGKRFYQAVGLELEEIKNVDIMSFDDSQINKINKKMLQAQSYLYTGAVLDFVLGEDLNKKLNSKEELTPKEISKINRALSMIPSNLITEEAKPLEQLKVMLPSPREETI